MTTATGILYRDIQLLKKGWQKAIQWFLASAPLGERGEITEVDLGSGLSAAKSGTKITITAAGGGGSVDSVTAGDATITIGGTASEPTVKVTPNTFDDFGDAAAALVAAEAYADSGDALRLLKSANLSDVASASTSRTNLGLGTAATHDVPASGDAGSSQVVLGNDSRLGGGSGTVTSVALALPSDIFAVSGSPVTGSGTLTGTKQTQTANTVFAGPTTGSAAQPAFRALVPADLPFGIDYLKVFDPRTQFYDYSEMLVTPTNNLEGWTTGFGNTAVLTSVVGTRGLWRVSLNTGLGGVAGGLNYVLGGGGATRNYFRFRIPTLSISTSRFTVDIGWRDNITGALNDGLLVRYSDNVNSGALQLISTVATVASSANGITALVANTWYDGYIDVNTGGTQAVLVLNGITECTLSASLSSTAVRKALLLSGTSGVGHVVDFDYMHIVGTR